MKNKKEKQEKLRGIYAILNIKNNHMYIGSTKDFESRKKLHIKELGSNKHHNYKIQADWEKYGEDAFVFSFIQEVDEFEKLTVVEKTIIDRVAGNIGVENLYNIILDPTVPYWSIKYEDKNIGNNFYSEPILPTIEKEIPIFADGDIIIYSNTMSMFNNKVLNFKDRAIFFELVANMYWLSNCVFLYGKLTNLEQFSTYLGISLEEFKISLSNLIKHNFVAVMKLDEKFYIYINPRYISGKNPRNDALLKTFEEESRDYKRDENNFIIINTD